MDPEAQRINFDEADRRYAELKRRYDAGEVSDEGFDEQRRSLMVRDEKGRWWAKSRKTGEWHYYDGNVWVNATPPYEPSKSSREPHELSIHKPSIDELIQICDKYNGPRFYVGDAIPGKALSVARSRFPIPADERVAALVDASRLLAKGFGLAVCEEGLRWRSETRSVRVKRRFLGWRDFAEISIKVHPPRMRSMYSVEIGKGNVFVAHDRDMVHDRLVQLLVEIQTLMKASLTG